MSPENSQDTDSDLLNLNQNLSTTSVILETELVKEEHLETSDIAESLLDTKGNKKSLFYLISVFSSTGQFFFGNFFSAFAANVGVSGTIMGFLTSVRNLLSSLFQGNIGNLSDKIGRKFIMIFGIALNFAITIPLIFFENIGLLVAVAVIQAFSMSVFMPSWNAVLGDITKTEIRATFIGKVTSIGRLVSVSFSLIIAVIFYLAEEVYSGWIILGWTVNIPWEFQYRTAFAIAAFNSLIAIILLFILKETNPEVKLKEKPKMRVTFKDRNFLKFVLFYSLFGFSMSLVWPLNPIIQVNVLGMQFYQIAIITSSFIIVMSITQVIAGKLGDKFGRKPVFIIGAFVLVFYPVSNLPSIITGNWLWQILGNAFAGIGTGSFFVSLNALTLDLAPEELMGSYSGIREMFFGIFTFIGSLVAGFIIDALDVRYGLYITTFSLCIGITILRFFASVGFLFVAESLPKEVRELRLNNHKNSKKI